MPRPRSFSEPHLLDAAIELFWAKGYAEASLAGLSEQTGVTNGSIYQAYGSKWGLFLAAFRVYCDRRVAVVAGAVEGAGEPGHDDVERTLEAYFDAIVDDCIARPDRRGCLMLNTISEFGTDDDVAAISSRAIAGMERSLDEALAKVAPDTTGRDAISVSAAQAVALSQAMIQLSRIGRSADELRAIGRSAASATQLSLRAA